LQICGNVKSRHQWQQFDKRAREAMCYIFTMRIRRILGLTVLLAIPAVVLLGAQAAPSADTLPCQLSDAEFWRIVNEFSEPSGPYD
jgi:hypothetical protein